MNTRLLIIIGISVVITISLLSYAIYDSSTTVFISCDPRYEQIDDKCILKISETDYEELECLRLYKDIREISRTDGFVLAERETIDMHKSLVFEYIEKDCPDFPDLEFIYNSYKQNIPEPEPVCGPGTIFENGNCVIVAEPKDELTQKDNFDSNKYYEEFGSGSPLIYKDTSKPVLDYDNCDRYAYWLTEHQQNDINRYDEKERYQPWGNQIFPLVNYCITNGDLVKTIVNDNIRWEFQLQ